MKILKIIFIVLVLVGIGISSYLTYIHFSESSIVCSPENSGSYLDYNSNGSDCDSTLNSKYSIFLGIPVSIFGILFYLTSLLVFILFLVKEYKYVKEILFFITFTGLFVSIYFSYLQLFVIESFCIYCFTSAFITLLLFFISIYIKLKNKN